MRPNAVMSFYPSQKIVPVSLNLMKQRDRVINHIVCRSFLWCPPTSLLPFAFPSLPFFPPSFSSPSLLSLLPWLFPTPSFPFLPSLLPSLPTFHPFLHISFLTPFQHVDQAWPHAMPYARSCYGVMQKAMIPPSLELTFSVIILNKYEGNKSIYLMTTDFETSKKQRKQLIKRKWVENRGYLGRMVKTDF